jgi:hypothetical protein
MPDHGAQYMRKKEEAIAALISQRTVEAAALFVGIGVQTLYRWKRDPDFDADFRAAKRADYDLQMALLRQGSAGSAASMINLMVDQGAKESLRLEAAIDIVEFGGDAHDMDDLTAAIAEMERARQQASPGIGHGSKLSRKMEAAIVQLFDKRSIAAAAAASGIGVPTLYRWLKEPAFQLAFAAAEGTVFGQAMTMVQKAVSVAVSLIRNFACNPNIPKATRLKADRYIYNRAREHQMKALGALVAAAEPASPNAGTSKSERTSKMTAGNLLERLKRLRGLLPAHSGQDGFEFVHSKDGKPTGSSVIGSNGWQVWSRPPAGCKEGEPLKKEDIDPVPDRAIA